MRAQISRVNIANKPWTDLMASQITMLSEAALLNILLTRHGANVNYLPVTLQNHYLYDQDKIHVPLLINSELNRYVISKPPAIDTRCPPTEKSIIPIFFGSIYFIPAKKPRTKYYYYYNLSNTIIRASPSGVVISSFFLNPTFL